MEPVLLLLTRLMSRHICQLKTNRRRKSGVYHDRCAHELSLTIQYEFCELELDAPDRRCCCCCCCCRHFSEKREIHPTQYYSLYVYSFMSNKLTVVTMMMLMIVLQSVDMST